MRSLLRRLFTREKARTGRDEEFGWILPPSSLVDSVAWDRYWQDQVTHGVTGLVDMFCHDGALVDAMRVGGLQTVLCVGNGLSQEARALASAGFDVTALDLSPMATDLAQRTVPPPEHLARLVDGRSGSNGPLQFVVGDLCDRSVCPGPFDVVIERRTLQLYPVEQRSTAMRAVADRLASPGIFFSHCHDGGWRPPLPPRHATEDWFDAQGWHRWRGDAPLAGRVAWLFTSTG